MQNAPADKLVEKYDKIACDIVKKADNEFYGPVIEKILSSHGISLAYGIYDRIDQYIERYDADDLESALELAQKLSYGIGTGGFHTIC